MLYQSGKVPSYHLDSRVYKAQTRLDVVKYVILAGTYRHIFGIIECEECLLRTEKDKVTEA
jgi:transcriptional regulator NrdR family protein